MTRALLALFLFASAAWSACTKMAMPTDYAIVTNGTRANLKANFTEIQGRFNPCADSVDEVRGRFTGYTGSLGLYSLENLRLRLDADGSTTAKLIVETSNGDSLFRVSEDSTAKFFGSLAVAGAVNVTGGDLTVGSNSTAKDLVVNGPAAANRNLLYETAGGLRWRLSANNATESGSNAGSNFNMVAYTDGGSVIDTPVTIARVASGTMALSRPVSMASTLDAAGNIHTSGTGTGFWCNPLGTFTYGMYTSGGNLLFRSGSTSAYLTVNSSGQPTFANAVSMSSALGVTGLLTASGGLAVNGGSAAAGTLWKSATGGLMARGVTGSSYDLDLTSVGGSDLIRNPTGTNNLEFPNGSSTFTGKVTGSDTIAASLGFRAGSTAASNVTWYRTGADMWGTDDSVTVAGRIHATAKITTADTMRAQNGFQAGGVAASNVNLYRTSADMWKTDDSLTVSGSINPAKINMGILSGAEPQIGAGFWPSNLTGTDQYGVHSKPTCSSAATNTCTAFYAYPQTVAASYTVGSRIGVDIGLISPGAGSTITNDIGLNIGAVSQGTNNWAIKTSTGKVQFGDSLVLARSLTFASASTPPTPASSGAIRQYQKGSLIVFQYNDAGTVRYKYLDMAGTGVTWVHSTTAP